MEQFWKWYTELLGFLTSQGCKGPVSVCLRGCMDGSTQDTGLISIPQSDLLRSDLPDLADLILSLPAVLIRLPGPPLVQTDTCSLTGPQYNEVHLDNLI
jgi:hypothetical protein